MYFKYKKICYNNNVIVDISVTKNMLNEIKVLHNTNKNYNIISKTYNKKETHLIFAVRCSLWINSFIL